MSAEPGNTCFKCKVTLIRGDVTHEKPRVARVRSDRWGSKATGNASSIGFVSWVCPTCRKTRAVSGA